MSTTTMCAHCGEERRGWSRVRQYELCHTEDKNLPDCYRRVTVYGEPLGVLQDQRPLPHGVNDIRKEVP